MGIDLVSVCSVHSWSQHVVSLAYHKDCKPGETASLALPKVKGAMRKI